MKIRQGIDRGAVVTTSVGRSSQVVHTIATPAGFFRTIRKDVFDRAMRSANDALKQSATQRGDVGEP